MTGTAGNDLRDGRRVEAAQDRDLAALHEELIRDGAAADVKLRQPPDQMVPGREAGRESAAEAVEYPFLLSPAHALRLAGGAPREDDLVRAIDGVLGGKPLASADHLLPRDPARRDFASQRHSYGSQAGRHGRLDPVMKAVACKNDRRLDQRDLRAELSFPQPVVRRAEGHACLGRPVVGDEILPGVMVQPESTVPRPHTHCLQSSGEAICYRIQIPVCEVTDIPGRYGYVGRETFGIPAHNVAVS